MQSYLGYEKILKIWDFKSLGRKKKNKIKI